MHGWVAYSHGVGDEATFRGELAVVVGSGTTPHSATAHVQLHAYVSTLHMPCLRGEGLLLRYL